MAASAKFFHHRCIAAALSSVFLVFLYGCDGNRHPTKTEDYAELNIVAVFVPAAADSGKNKSKRRLLEPQGKSNGKPRAEFSAGLALQQIDRITISVSDSNNVKVVEERELTIVEAVDGRFAEGEVSIPVRGSEETFRIDVRAFENLILMAAGNTQVTLKPGEVRTDPVIVEIPLLGTGDVQITLTWNTATDQDLHVIDPSGFRIYFEQDTSPTGGILDFDNTEGFGPENIFWPSGQAPNGRYKVQVVYFGGAGATDVTVVVRRSDAPLQTFNRTIEAEDDTLDVTEFEFTGGGEIHHQPHRFVRH
jgi:hypothetical protein